MLLSSSLSACSAVWVAQKCTDSNFCSRLRGVKGPELEILHKSVNIAGPAATARLQDGKTKAEFDLALTAYDGVLRLRVTEPAKDRFEVPDTLQQEFIDKPLSWTSNKASAKSLTLQLGTAAVTLDYKPFRLTTSIANVPTIDVNSRSLFSYEYKREKQVLPVGQVCAALSADF